MVVREIARACAWDHMSDGCTRPPSPRCVFRGGLVAGDDELGTAGALKVDLENRLEAFAIHFRAMFGSLSRPIFGTERESRVNRPRTIGGGDLGVSGQYLAMCNELPAYDRPRETQTRVPRLLSNAWCETTGWCE